VNGPPTMRQPDPPERCPRCQLELRTHPLTECSRCGRWTNHLEPDGCCLDCNLGWTHCPEHGALEYASGRPHQKVSVFAALTTLRAHQIRHLQRRRTPASEKG
jgi:hypothetical protein